MKGNVLGNLVAWVPCHYDDTNDQKDSGVTRHLLMPENREMKSYA